MSIIWTMLYVLSASAFMVIAEESAGLTPLAGSSKACDASEIRLLIQKLSGRRFADRDAAEKILIKQPRTALPELMKYQSSDDPELAERIRRITSRIKEDPANIPEAFFSFVDGADFTSYVAMQAYWDEAMKTWETTAIVGAKNDNSADTSATGGSFAQSFIPHTNRISAIAVQLYLPYEKEVWVSLDVCEDNKGLPGDYVLARAWLKTRKHGPAPPHAFVVFDIPDLDVEPQRTYWIKFVDKEQKANYGLSLGRDAYPEGKYLGPVGSDGAVDAKFRVISKCEAVPLLRAAAEEDVKLLKSSVSVSERAIRP